MSTLLSQVLNMPIFIVPYYEGNEIAIDMIATKIKALLLDKK